ncbi:ankyrin repeat-containing domain protein [Dactylonectria estremocensis]|uniref:Ankyrin repeat-containing domain protein n=1 Tax=Dactylonectria estremocensis TaxID=1079267 RepID=A0A9P9E9K8_9HYPO|nr:ankyrin repeat-containing domain protein [Dactylonectria estremocensis]
MSVNWKLYEQDINRWYLDESKPVRETVQLLKDTHHVVVTERQFKTKFGGLKNLRADEWKAVIPHIRRREAQGAASVVFLSGKRLKLDSMTRAIRRYSKSRQGETTNETEIDLGIDTFGLHRIEIRTPIEYSAAPALVHHPSASRVSARTTEVQLGSYDVVHTESSRKIVLASQVIELDDIEIDFGTHMDIDSSVESVLHLPNLSASSQLGLGSITAGENRPNPFSQFLDLESCSRNGPKRPFQSFWDLPEITSLTSSIRESSSLRTVLDSYSEAQTLRANIHRYSEFGDKYQDGWVLSKLVDANSRLVALDTIAELVGDLIQSQMRLSKRQVLPSDVADAAAISAASVHLHNKLFPVVAFLISNNHHRDEEIVGFLRWVINNGFMTQLWWLLEMAPTDALALRTAFLKAICTASSTSEEFRELFRSSEFLNLVASHRYSFPGPLGARLLFSHGVDINQRLVQSQLSPVAFAAGQGREAVMDYLISAGADIHNETTALFQAIQKNHPHIVENLLGKGARFSIDETVENQKILDFARRQNPTIYSMLLKMAPLIDGLDIYELIDAAEMGNQEVSSFLLKHGIVQTEIMERALCGAIKMGKVNAVGTLLRRRVDPNARLAQLLASSTKSYSDIEVRSPVRLLANSRQHHNGPDILYLLVKAGATVDEEVAQELYLRYRENANPLRHDPNTPGRILSVLLQSDCIASWIGPTRLVLCAKMGYISNCSDILDKGTAINGYGLDGESALQMAAEYGHVALMHYLLNRGADVNLAPGDGDGGATALYAALRGEQYSLVNDLVNAGADVTAGTGHADGATILEAMKANNNGEDFNRTFKNLIALGAPINRTNGTASRLLHSLVILKQHECLELALRAGARTEDTWKGLTPLQLAAFEGDMDSIRVLIAHGAKVNAARDEESYHLSSQTSSTFICPQGFGFYRRMGRDEECLCTALQAAIASKFSSRQLIELLLEHGANINAPAIATFGRTALQGATSSDNPNLEIIRLLLLHGSDVNAPPAKRGGVTALQGAAIKGHLEVTRLLLAHGALINALPALEEGRTAMEGAAEHGRLEMVRFLFSEGALPDPFLGFSRAIELAEKECHLGIVKFLKEHDPCNLLLTNSPILS